MRTSVVVGTLAILGLAAGGGYYGLEVYPQQLFRTGLDQALATLPPGTTASYKTAHYSVLAHQAVVTGLSVHGEIPGDAPQPFDVTVATVEATNPNLDFSGLWARAIATRTAFGPDTALPVADAVTISGMTVHSSTIDLTEERIHAAKLRLYPWALLHDGMPSWKDLLSALTPGNGRRDVGNLPTILRAEAAVMAGIAYDNYEAGPTRITETLAGTDIRYDVGKMTSDAFDRGTIKGGSAESITFNGSQFGLVSIDHVALGSIDVRQPMTRLISGEPLSSALLNGVTIGQIEYSGITAQLPGRAATHIRNLSLGPLGFARGIPVSAKLGWTDLIVSRSQVSDQGAKDVFDELGLDTMTTSFTFAYDWDVAKQQMSVHDTVLKVKELGTISISAELTDAIPNAASMSQIRLAHAKLRFDDASLVDRVLRAGAVQSGTDPVAYRAQVVDLVRKQSGAPGFASPEMEAACQAAGDFLASPHALSIELSPPQPVPVAALQGMRQSPGMLATALGLVVSTAQ
jgi:hypothetical protein